MKKVFFVLTLLFGMVVTDTVMAQERYPVFSGSLGGGSGGVGVRRTFYRPNSSGGVVASRPQAVRRKKTILKYAPDQVLLTEKQMERLMPMIKRIQDGKISSLEVVVIDTEYEAVSRRQTELVKLFLQYVPNFEPSFREISGPAVIASNDNTAEFIEYY